MTSRFNSFSSGAAMFAAAVAAFPSSALAAQSAVPVAGVQALGIPTAGAVGAFYDRYQAQPIWFRGPAATAAANQLVPILRRATFDGLAAGPALAIQVETAIRQAASGRPADIAAAERLLSSAWVMYVQSLKRPTPDMIYAYDVLKPQGTRADQILLTAAAAPSLDQHVRQVSAVNPLYAQIRDAAWNEAQAKGNLTPDPRLIANLNRLRSIPANGRFIVVDSGTQRMTLFENGQPYDSMKIIVGTDEMKTPLIASVMHYVTLNPYWNAPDHLARSIAKNYLSRGASYLKANGYEVMADWTENSAVIPNDKVDWKAIADGRLKARVRQKPGKGNFMGTMKFPFPNGEDIYLHDTPAKELFAKSDRTLSNGCVRLEDASRFGRWLLGREPVAPTEEPEQHVQLPRGVPIYLTYTTAEVKDGQLSYRSDPYGWDRVAAQQVAASQ